MNNVTPQQIEAVVKFSKIALLGRLFSSELTEWKAIVFMQNVMDGEICNKYVSILDSMGCSLVTATIDQRVEAYIKAHSR